MPEDALLQASDLERCLAWIRLSVRESESRRWAATIRTMGLTDIVLAVLTAVLALACTWMVVHLRGVNRRLDRAEERAREDRRAAEERAREDREVNRADHARLFSAVSGLQVEVSDLKADVSTLKGDVSTLKGDVSTLQANVSTLQAKVDLLLAKPDGSGASGGSGSADD